MRNPLRRVCLEQVVQFCRCSLTSLGLLGLSLASASLARAQEVQWLHSAEQAANVAAESGKPILVYVRSANCHYCDLMQSNVWQDPTTASIVMRDFVPLKLTREDNPQAVSVLKIKGFPSTVIFSADRNYVDRLDGYVAPERFLSAVSKMHSASTVR